jgi:23S rRNA pseudouridine2605 synthase
MCDAVGYPVVRLVRTRIGPVRDDRLQPGAWRALRPAEVRALYESAGPQPRPSNDISTGGERTPG